MLIDSHRLSDADRLHWRRCERADAMYVRAHGDRLDRLEAQAIADLRDFFRDGTGYAGVSWGKDSVVVATLLRKSGLEIPLVWVRVEPIQMPECYDVRDVFAPTNYHEIEIWCEADPSCHDGWHQTGTLERGFAEAALRFGDRYASGIRGQEASVRKLRMMTHGVASPRTLAPIGWWRTSDVFAYLHREDSPVHPAYAMTRGGTLDRERLRVSHLTLRRGDGHGRREWEDYYYGDKLAECLQSAVDTE